MLSQILTHTLYAFYDSLPLRRQIDSHTVFAVVAVECAGVNPNFGVLYHGVFGVVGVLDEVVEIHPHQVRAFQRRDGCGRKFLGEYVLGSQVVLVDIIVEIVEPLLAARVGVGGHQRNNAEGIDVADFVDVDCAVYLAASLGARADDVGDL